MAEKTIQTSPAQALNPIIVTVPYKEKLSLRFTLQEYSISYQRTEVSIVLREELLHDDAAQPLRDKTVKVKRKNTGAQIEYELDDEGAIKEDTAVEIKAAATPVSDFLMTKTGDGTISDAGQTLISAMVNEHLATLS